MATEQTLQQLVPLVIQEAGRQGVDPSLAVSILIAENTADGTYDPMRKVRSDTKSPQEALGVMQVLPSTFQGLARKGVVEANGDMTDVGTNIRAGVGTLKDLQEQFKTADPTLIAIGYHGGPTAVRSYLSTPASFAASFPKTAGYVGKLQKARSTYGGATPDGEWRQAQATGGTVGSLQQQYSQTASQMDVVSASLADWIKRSEQNMSAASGAFDASNVASEGLAKANRLTGEQQLNVRNTAQKATGTDLADPSSFIIQRMQEISGAEQQLKTLLPQVSEAKAANPFLDPLGWIGGQMQLRSLQPKIQQLSTIIDMGRTAIADRRAIAGDYINHSAQTTQEALTLQEASSVDLARAQNRLKQLELNQNAAGLQARLVMDGMNAQGNLFNMNAALLRLSAEKLGQKKLDDANADEQALVDKANIALQFVVGKPALFGSKLEFSQFTRTPAKKELIDRLTTGISPGLYISAVNELGALPELERTDPNRGTFTREFMAATAKQVQAGRADPKNPAARTAYQGTTQDQAEAAGDAVVLQWQKETTLHDPAQLSPSNPFRMRPVVYASAPTLQGNVFSKFVQEYPKTSAPIDERTLIAHARELAAVDPGKASQVAQQLSQFFSEGARMQDRTFGLEHIGIKRTPDAAYTYKAPSGSIFVSDKNINLTNAVDVEAYLVRQAIYDSKRAKAIDTAELMRMQRDAAQR